jgi:hypothetical protein
MQKVLTKSQLPATTGDPSSHDISIYFHPERVICIILLDIVYNPLGLPFDLEAMLEMTEKQLGRALFALATVHCSRWPRELAGARGESVDGIARGG